MDNNWYWV